MKRLLPRAAPLLVLAGLAALALLAAGGAAASDLTEDGSLRLTGFYNLAAGKDKSHYGYPFFGDSKRLSVPLPGIF